MQIHILFVSILTLCGATLWAQDSDVVEAGAKRAKEEIKEEKESEKKKKTPEDSEDLALEKPAKGFEKIEVTGSYVQRIDIEGPSPVVTIEKEAFEKAGVDTVSDYLRENSMFTGSSDSGDRDGSFRFRGQHAGSTLVLINGMRVPKLGGPDRGFYSGVESIPTNIIERVEVVKDGSSALYGSDAMAGVMNFITKKDYDGAEYSTRINVPEINKGLQQNHTISFGKNYARGNWFASVQYVEQRGYTEKDAGNYYKGDVAPASSKATVTSVTGNDRMKTKAQAACINNPSDTSCQADFRGVDMVRDPRENIGTILSGRYELTNDISFQAVGIYNRRSRLALGRPNWVNINEREGDALIQPNQVGSSQLKQLATGNDGVEVAVNPYDEVGTARTAVLQNAFSLQTKTEGYFLDTWRWELSDSYAYSIETRDHQNGLVSKTGVKNLMADGYNPLAVGQNSDAFNTVGVRIQGTEAYEASLGNARLIAAGELFDLASLWGVGGPVSLAMGIEGQWETTNDAHDDILIREDLNQNFEENQYGSRTVNSAFTEIVAYPLDSIEMQLAGRYDGYSDFGGTFNPKFSLAYRPSKTLMLRGSWGTNFNAPSVRNMIQRDQVGYEDLQFCDQSNSDCSRQTFAVNRYREEDLQPELGVNYNFGTVIQPNKRWTFTIDQWNFEGEDTLSKVSGSGYSAIYRSLYAQDPSTADAKMRDLGVDIIRDSQGNVVSANMPAVTNMGLRTIRGLDINIAFNSPIRLFGRVLRASASMDHTHMLVYRTKTSDTLDWYNRTDLEWKNTLSFSLSTRQHAYRWAARTLAGDTDRDASVRTSTEYDFNYDWRIPYWSGKLSLGVKNLLNTRPPVDQSKGFVDYTDGYNTYAFQALGRRYYVGYSHTF